MRRTLDNALDQAIEKHEMDAKGRLRLRLILAFRPDARTAVLSYIKEMAATDATFVAMNLDFTAIDIDQFEKWIQLIIKYLPEIIALIQALFP